MIKYIGSKRVLLPQIVAAITSFEGARTVLDAFSGTSRVGHALKRAGMRVTANDHLAYAATLARCYVQADARRVLAPARALLEELARVPPRAGYFTETFCERSRFFQPHNGARVDAIRDAIAERRLEPDLEAVVLTSLMEAADRVDSTTGVQMAYLKGWAKRSYNELELRVPDVLEGGGRALTLDALEAVREVASDVTYLDPPYNQHRYVGNYHVWETLVRWDAPEVYGVACKRVQCRDYRSDYNSKVRIHAALEELVTAVRSPHLVVSFNDEGFVDRGAMEAILSRRGHVRVAEIDFRRYVGARIGIYNPDGEKVGRVSHLRNKELLFVVSEDAAGARRAVERIDHETRQGSTGSLFQ